MMPLSNPYANYKQQAVNTMSPGEQLVKLFDEALKDIKQASILYKAEDFERAEDSAEGAKAIFQYLSSVLNREVELSANLFQLYDFLKREIIRAQIRRDVTVLEGLVPVIEGLRDAWVQAEKLNHMNRASGGE